MTEAIGLGSELWGNKARPCMFPNGRKVFEGLMKVTSDGVRRHRDFLMGKGSRPTKRQCVPLVVSESPKGLLDPSSDDTSL